jgi:hypothetical protein
MSNAKIGFAMKTIRLLLENILPVRQITEAHKKANRYETILASLKVVGLVEPLVVFPQKGQPGKYMLVNGHMRHYAMKELGMTAADCIIANDDEGFTYNARISRLPAIQEHKMISRAVKNGASLERIAAALNISTQGVKASLNLLVGISHVVKRLCFARAVSTVEHHLGGLGINEGARHLLANAFAELLAAKIQLGVVGVDFGVNGKRGAILQTEPFLKCIVWHNYFLVACIGL